MRPWINIVALVILGIGSQSYAQQSQLTMIEEVWVPDSVFSPYHGIDFDFVVWKWQWHNGIRFDRPFKDFDAYMRAVEYQGYRDPEPIVIPPERLPIEFNRNNTQTKRLYKSIEVIRKFDDVPIFQDNIIYLIEEEISPNDPDTAGAHFSSYDDFGQPYQPYNSRYLLYDKGKLELTFKAYSSLFGSYPIQDTKVWDKDYSFTYQAHSESGSRLHAVFNGKDLTENGYQNTLGCAMLDGELFFIYQKNNKWGWFYNGEEHSSIWDKVYYQYGDGECGPHSSPGWSGICALRDGMWYMVRFERERQ